MTKLTEYNSYFYCVLAIFIFSTNELVGKFIDTSITPIAITSYRFFIGSFFLALFILRNKKKYVPNVSIKYIFIISIIGILNVCVSMYTLQLGIYYGQAAFSAIIVSSNPIFVSIFAIFILKEKLTIKTVVCLVSGLLGLSLVIFGQFSNTGNSINIVLGILFSIIASITFALYTVLSKKQIKKTNSIFFNAVSFFAGALVMMFVGLLSRQDMSFTFNRNVILGMLYLGIFVTGIAYIAYFEGLKNVKASIGTSFFLLKPVFASVLAYFLLKESLTFLQIIGVLIVIISVFLQSYLKEVRLKRQNIKISKI
ncbi:MAG: DMT family transporter [Candidatus Cloacimonetes bacterium]|nr:DMT family transporter [Candidatus Cloacimonadota bacterium]